MYAFSLISIAAFETCKLPGKLYAQITLGPHAIHSSCNFCERFTHSCHEVAQIHRSRPLENPSELPSDHFGVDPAINTVKHEEFSKKAKNQTTRGHVAQIHLREFSLSFSVAEWQISPVPRRFLLFVYYFSTIEICFSCNVGIKFHIKVALFFERSGKHICICNTPSEIMQLFCECCFPHYMRSRFLLICHPDGPGPAECAKRLNNTNMHLQLPQDDPLMTP